MEAGGGARRAPRYARRRRRSRLALPLVAIAVGAFAAGLVLAAAPGRSERALVTQYMRAWSREDYRAMYALLAPATTRTITEPRFAAAYRGAAETATLVVVSTRSVGSRRGDFVPVRVRARTRLFGTLTETLSVPLVGTGSSARIRFTPALTFPGLAPGERLTRRIQMPPRATLLAADGTPLATGPARSSPVPAVASAIVGVLGPIPAAQAGTYVAEGYPRNAKVGLDGLERVFERRLAGTPGGTLVAGRRVLAFRAPTPAGAVRTTISPSIERAVISAIGGRYAGMVAMDPRTGAILGAAGIAFSGLQPPGSTMKIITATAALEAGIVKLDDTFPVATSATIDGYTLHNAGGEACGGTLVNAFAVSCNSVFAPLGARLGGARLVAAAERFGFDQPPPFPGAAESTIPSAARIGGALDVGSSAIGQGKVQASALEMTDAAAAIAIGGARPAPTLLAGRRPVFVRATTPQVAALVQRMMIAVVSHGTGTAAQVPGVEIAGKTGTAEIVDAAAPGASAPQSTDSWFVGYGPVGAPRIVVGALFPGQGAGAATAAPAVHEVLAVALTGRS
ncbi:MAG: hypothetical protein JO168_12235 [Solirubrobacterales bacterium]|nr:hypothetical protein [Solirubrobacterales bacterium]